MTHDYSMDYFAVYSGCSDETQASPSTITKVIDYINEFNCDYVFVLEGSDKRIANQIVSNSMCKKNVEILILNSCQFVPVKDLNKISLFNVMSENLVKLKKALRNENI